MRFSKIFVNFLTNFNFISFWVFFGSGGDLFRIFGLFYWIFDDFFDDFLDILVKFFIIFFVLVFYGFFSQLLLLLLLTDTKVSTGHQKWP